MNRYIAVLRNESWIIVADIVLILFWWYHNPYLLDKLATFFDGIGLPGLFSANFVMIVVFAIPLALFVVAARHDTNVNSLPKDERELQNELKISDTGHLICINGLTTYLIFAPYHPEMVWLWGVLVLTFLARLWKRYELERD